MWYHLLNYPSDICQSSVQLYHTSSHKEVLQNTTASGGVQDDRNHVRMLMGSCIRMRGHGIIVVISFIIYRSSEGCARGIKSIEEYAKAAFMASQSRGVYRLRF